MAAEMPEELLQAMQNLSQENWDTVVEAWKKGEIEKIEYEQLYYKQVDNQKLSNRLFGEHKKLFTPQDRAAEIDETIINLANDLDVPKEDREKEHAEDAIETASSRFFNMLSSSKLKEKDDVSPLEKEQDRDIDRE